MKRSGTVLLSLLVFALGAACSSGGGSTATTSPPPASATTTAPPASSAGADSVTITVADFSFSPSSVTVSTSQAIVLKNTGAALHNFSIDGTSVTIDIQPGQTQTLAAPGPSFKAGTYQFFCKYHKSQGMVGTLTATSG